MGEEVDINKFVRWIDANAQLKSQHTCAKAVRQGLEAGGLDVSKRPEMAKDYGAFLEKNGFKVIGPDGYSPQKGDIVVFQPGPNPAGHIQVWNGRTWVSDFVQNPNKVSPYGNQTPSYAIYRQGSHGFWRSLVQNLKGIAF
ncbi:MAG: hypothetical protein A2049_00605 [Elusimicrobia bacterium GWA2_62_23]|nr:MAG: hypothetical protein A2049_00605 [Elusimicrobia bacterium GWA2_62_23]